ncbi:hypothetical protein GCM10023079_52630 [Streptomyces chitinivorans]
MNTVPRAETRSLHGRSAEISALRHAIRFVRRSGSLSIAFEGGPGVGKSRLLAEARTIAEASGVTVVHGLYGEHGEFDRPLVVLLDDIHNSSTSDAEVFAGLRLKTANVPVVWCTSRRWGKPNSPLDSALASMAGPHRLFRLGPLDDRAAREMTRDLLSAEPDAALARMTASLSGHPQALRTLVEGLLEEGMVNVGVAARLTRPGLPEKFAGLVRRYLQDCSSSCTNLLLVASVLGRRLVLGELAEVLGTRPSHLLPDLREGVLAGLLSQDGDDVRFANELFRCVIRDSVPATARAAVREQADQHRARRFGAALAPAGWGTRRHAASGPAAKSARDPMAPRRTHKGTFSPAPLRRAEEPGGPAARQTGSVGPAPALVAQDASGNASVLSRRAQLPSGMTSTAIPGWDRLTEKQAVIAELAMQGLTNKGIAERLYLSPHTVNYHLRKIFHALSIRSRTDLVRIAHAPSALGTQEPASAGRPPTGGVPGPGHEHRSGRSAVLTAPGTVDTGHGPGRYRGRRTGGDRAVSATG